MKRLVGIVLALAGTHYLSAVPSFSFNLAAELGAFFDTTHEYVYDGSVKESQLDWQELGIPYIGLGGLFNVASLFVNVQARYALPLFPSGLMEDYDWMNPDKSRYSHYSQHTAAIEKHLEANIDIGWTFKVGALSLAPAVGFAYRNRKWSASDGYLQYIQYAGQIWSPALPKEDVHGTVITYEEHTWYPVISLEAALRIGNRFDIAAGFGWYPYVEIATVDTHVMTESKYLDAMKGDSAMGAHFTGTFYPASLKSFAFFVSVHWTKIVSKRGSSSTEVAGGALVYAGSDVSKMESNLFRAGLGVLFFPQKIGKR